MKKMIITSILIFLMLSLLIVVLMDVPQDIYYNLRDKSNWEDLVDDIVSDELVEVSLDMYELTASDQEKIFDDLLNADFYKSNWKQEGPTGAILTLRFEDDRFLHFSYWGGGILETRYHDGQFLIISSTLEIRLNEIMNDR